MNNNNNNNRKFWISRKKFMISRYCCSFCGVCVCWINMQQELKVKDIHLWQWWNTVLSHGWYEVNYMPGLFEKDQLWFGVLAAFKYRYSNFILFFVWHNRIYTSFKEFSIEFVKSYGNWTFWCIARLFKRKIIEQKTAS